MITPSGVGVALADGVAVALGDGDGDGDVVTDAGRTPAVLTTEPSGANSSDPAAPLTPRDRLLRPSPRSAGNRATAGDVL